MSQHSVKKINCPICGQVLDFTVWKTINTVSNPEMKEKVRTREAFTLRCPECGEMINLDYGFLYFQMEDEMMIYYASDQKETENVYKMFRENGKAAKRLKELQSKFLYRIVHSQNELREKLCIFDAGLDDRVIELAKLLYAGIFFTEHPEAESDVVYFRPEDMTFVSYNESKPVATAVMNKNYYDLIFEEYIAERPPLRDDDIIIDMDWAYKVICQKG